jgi:hypothetical protein
MSQRVARTRAPLAHGGYGYYGYLSVPIDSACATQLLM